MRRYLLALLLVVAFAAGGLSAQSGVLPDISVQAAGGDVTMRLGSFDNDTVIFEADYAQGNKKVTRIRAINNGGFNARITVVDPFTGEQVAQTTFLPGTSYVNVAAGQAVVWNPDGYYEIPYNYYMDYPAP